MGVGTLSKTGSEEYLQPGGVVVGMPEFVLTHEPSPDLLASVQRKATSLIGLQRAKTVAISLDSAIFASGQFVGPDTYENFARDAAYFTAWRSVDADVQSRLANDIPFDEIATWLSQLQSQPIPGAGSTRDWNAQVRSTQARQLLKLYQRSGEKAVRDLVQRQLQQPAIVVHR